MPPVLRYLGLAEETSYAVDPAPAAAFDVDIASASLDPPNDPDLLYGGGLSRSVRTRRPGFYAPAGNLVYAMDIRTIGWILKWALGGYTHTDDTAGSGFQIHEMYGDDDTILPSFAARLGKDVFEHVVSGCVVNSLQIQVQGEYVVATVDTTGAKDAKAALRSRDALALPTEFPLAFHETTLTLAGGSLSAKVKSLTLTIGNNLRVDSGRGIGQRYPYRLPAGERNVGVGIDLWYEDTAELERFWGDADGISDGGASDFAAAIDIDGGTDGSLTIDVPKAHYSQAQQQPSGRDEITNSLQLTALEDTITLDDGATEVESELLATLSNNETEMTA